jgi:hypothetical protein
VIRLYGYSSGVILRWTAVPGASFYVLQMCPDNSFAGPNLIGIKVIAQNEYELAYLEHARLNQEVFWRVAACDGAGGLSGFSPPFSFKIECPTSDADTDYDNESGDYAQVSDPQLCDKTGVDLKLVGPTNMRMNDTQRVFALSINYDCDSLDAQPITVDSVVWEIVQSTSQPAEITEASDYYIKVDTDADDEEIIEVKATVLFEIEGGVIYECSVQQRVMIEGLMSGGGGELYLVEFNDVDCAAGTAQVVVLQEPCGGGLRASAGEQLSVVDRTGCNLTGEADTLIGLRGWVTPMEPMLGQPAGYDGCEWVIVNMCCPGFGC